MRDAQKMTFKLPTHEQSRPFRLILLAGVSAGILSGCANAPFDLDMRGVGGGFTTANAAKAALADRPRPDARGVISYPNYQVVVAERGDTLQDVAARIGVDAQQLSRFNGVDPDVPLRKGEIIALPTRVAEPSTAPAASSTVDISSLASGAIDRVPASPSVQSTALPAAQSAAPAVQTGKEPVRHKVERGETAYTISRLYAVPVKALADWNGLGADFAIREGQFLLIPVPKQNPPSPAPSPTNASATVATPPAVETTLPGDGSPTPVPPSAAKPLPKDDTAQPLPVAKPAEPVADVGKTSKPAKATKMVPPVKGTIIRGYSKGRNEGINIKAAAGTPVKSAEGGVVAAITKSAEGVPIIVVRHPDNLLTVYANVTDVTVAKGDAVGRGQSIAKLRTGSDAYVHFEVRKGFDSIDPTPFIN